MDTNLWHDIKSDKNSPDIVNVVVETPKGSKNRYTYHKKYNMMKLDAVFYSPIHYPGDYGFVPRTYGEDSNPLNIIVLSNEPSYPGIMRRARPIALLRVLHQGVYDDKIISVPVNDPAYRRFRDKKDLSKHVIEEIEHFFNVYKHLEGKSVKKMEWKNASIARKVIERGIRLYERKFS